MSAIHTSELEELIRGKMERSLETSNASEAAAQEKQDRFYQALRDLFVGAEVEGESGYINLMKIKFEYYEDVRDRLERDIQEVVDEHPGFRAELFDKLYDFFHRYFSDTGSIYFRRTRYPQSVYEQVYTDEKDVMLFWKTRMLYYVKTERQYQDLEVRVDEQSFLFDVSEMQRERANERRKLIYRLKEVRKDGTIVLGVKYRIGNAKTDIKAIGTALRNEEIYVDGDTLKRALGVFAKQSRVDCFINQDAEKFLKEQFELWMYQYLYKGKSQWEQERIEQLQLLEEIAFQIIEFIAEFEQELVRIWEKPKFVRNANYVITLDRVAKRDMGIVESIMTHDGIESQVGEWQRLGIVGEDFDPRSAIEGAQDGGKVSMACRYLPIDTKHFKDLETQILGAFDHLDDALDGRLVKSDNYQALNTLYPRFGGRVQTIYVDPPFNTGDDFHYLDRFQDATWISLLQNRLEWVDRFLVEDGVVFVHLDWNADYLGRHLLEDLFDNCTEIIWDTNATKDEEAGLFSYKSFGQKYVRQHDKIFFCSGSEGFKFVKLWKPNRRTTDLPIGWLDLLCSPKESNPRGLSDYRFYIERYNEDGEFEQHEIDVSNEKIYAIGDIWNDVYSFMQSEMRVSENLSFDTQKPEHLLRRIIQSTTEPGDLVLDFFVGSGTTTAVAHKLKRKWIGVECDESFWDFYTVGDETKLGLLGRMKIVLSGDQEFKAVDKDRYAHLSKDINWKGGGFFKYYELEGYEDALRRAEYRTDARPLKKAYENPYEQYVFLADPKMLKALEVEAEEDRVRVNFSNLYDDIDVAETLANSRCQWIRRITSEFVEFENGEQVEFADIEWTSVRALIWWTRD